MATPRLVLEVFENVEGAENKSLGLVDLTYVIVQDMTPSRKFVREIEMPPRVMNLSPALNEEQKKVGWAGNLVIPEFEKHLADFIEQVGGLDRMIDFRLHLEDINQIRYQERSARSLLNQVEKAKLGKQIDFDFVYCSLLDKFGASIEEIYLHSDYRYDEYVLEHPRPDYSDDEAYKKWSEAHSQWIFDNAPPFVFGTTALIWAGVDEQDIRTQYEEEETFDLESYIDNEMQDHHEDAAENIVDYSELSNIIKEWLPHANSGDEIDLALKEKLEEWNQKQTITSYYADTKIVIPTRDDVTQADMVTWAQEQLDATRAKIEQVENNWNSEPAPTPAG